MNTPETAEFFATGGAVPLQSPSYCSRSADEELYTGLLQGEFCYLLATRQIGKTSLTARTAERLRNDGLDVACLDLTEVGVDCTKEQWYYTLLSNIVEDLDLWQELRTLWTSDAQITPLQRWINGIRMILRARPSQRLVIFIDEIDYVRALRFETSEFFAAIRACYNRRTIDPEFTRLTFCLIGVATPSDLIEDVRVTPFNIGRRIDLVDFSPEEAASLVHGFRCEPFLGRLLLERVLHWTCGHPYLTQRLCQEIALRPETLTAAQVDRLCADLFLSSAAQERDANLTFVRDRLLKSGADIAALLSFYDQVYRGRKVRHNKADPLMDILMLSGLVRSDQGEIVVRNRIYARVFDRTWVREHMPNTERRRQRAAFLRGAVRVAAVSLVLIGIVGGLGLVAQRQAKRAKAAERNTARLLYAADMNVTQQALHDNNTGHALELLDAQRPKTGRDEDLRGFEWRYFWRLSHQDLFTFHGHTNRVRSVAYSPDGTILASGGDDKTIHLWNIASGKGETLLGHQDWVFTVAFSPDGKILASGSKDHTVKLWDVTTRRLLRTLTGYSTSVKSISFSPDGKLLASSDDDDAIRLWDTTTWQPTTPLRGNRGTIDSVAFSPDGTTLANSRNSSRGNDIAIQIELWNLATRRQIKTFSQPCNIFAVAFSHNGRLLAAGRDDGMIDLWDFAAVRHVATGRQWPERPSHIYKAHTFVVNSLAFSRDDKTLASGSWDGTAKLWNVATRSELLRLPSHADTVNAVAFSPDGTTLATGSNDTTVKLWDIEPGHIAAYREMIPLESPYGPVYCLAFSSDGHTLCSGREDGSIILWNTTTLRPQSPLKVDNAVKNAAVLSSDGRVAALVYRSGDRRIGLLDVTTGCNRRLPSNGKDVGYAAFSPDEKLLANGAMDGAIKLWDTSSLRLKGTLRGHTSVVGPVAFSPNGKLLASGTSDSTVRLWDIATMSLVATLKGHTNGVTSVAFSPDGKTLASSNWDRTVILWDVAARRRIATLKGHTNQVNRVAFSPDGKTLVSAGDDKTLKLWNVATRQEMATFRYQAPIRAVAFSSDGNTLAVGLLSGTIYLIRAATMEQVRNYEAW